MTKKRKNYTIPLLGGGSATVIGKPSKETIEALNAMVELAKKMKIKKA